MRMIGRLDSAIVLPGVVIKRGTHTGELDGSVVWLDVATAPSAVLTGAPKSRRLAVPVSRFSCLEEAASAPAAEAVDPRAAVKAAIKVAEAKAREAGRAKT